MKNRLKIKCFLDELQYSIQKNVLLEGNRYSKGRRRSEIIGHANLLFENENTVKVRRSDYLFNGKRFCENPVEQCFVKAAEVMNDLHLSLTDDGVLRSIKNKDDVLRKWDHCKMYLDRFFISEEAQVMDSMTDYIEQFDNVIKSEDLFLSGVKRDLFYSIFFRGYYQDFGEVKNLFQNSSWDNLFGRAKSVIAEEWILSEESGYNRIRMKGQLNEDESDMKSIFQYLQLAPDDSLSVILNAESLLDNQGVPLSIDWSLDAKSESDYHKQISISIKKK